MTPEDARHGTDRGYNQHYRDGEKPCEDCNWAHTVAKKRRQLARAHKIPSLGTRRRIRALQALGWSVREITERLGHASNGGISYLMQSQTTTVATAARVAALYDTLAMIRPIGHAADRARRWAQRSGYAPPLAWDDIDNDTAPGGVRSVRTGYDRRDLVDESAVLRLLSGDRIPANTAERSEAMRRWLAAGKSERSLCETHGWHEGRYVQRETA